MNNIKKQMNKNKEFLQDCFLVNFHERVKAIILSWYHKLVHHPSTSEVFDITYFEFDKNKVTSKEVYYDLIPLIEEGGLCECVTTLVYYLVNHSNLSNSYATLYQQMSDYRREYRQFMV